MLKLTRSACALLLLASFLSSSAQDSSTAKSEGGELPISGSMADQQIDKLIESNKTVYIDGKPAEPEIQSYVDSVRRKIATFYYDQFRNFSDPYSPYFLFMSKDAALSMGIGGAVRMRAYYDWGGAQPSAGFSPYLIPIHPSPTSMRHFDTTPSGTCLYFRVIGRNKLLGDYQLNIETDFTGYQGRDLKLKKAYAIINDFTVGYASSTFSDPAALPPTIDASGPANKTTPTSVLVRYMPVVKQKWVFAVSVETPSTSLTVDNKETAKVDNYLPDLAAFAQYQWAQGQHIRVSGIVRSLPYRDLQQNENHNLAGWGLMVSSVARVTRSLSTYATVNYGHGYASLGGDLMMGAYDLIGDPATPGHLYAPASFGYCIGLQYHFRPELFVSANVSQTRYLPSHEVSPEEYKYGLVCTANIFWNMTARMQVGAEVNVGKRQNFSRDDRWGRRAALMCMFSF